MTEAAIIQGLLERFDRGTTWYERLAVAAYLQGRYRIIHGRTSDDVYLIRFWVSIPTISAEKDDDDRPDFESGNSLLLHYFPRPDDDAAGHDHPWSFRTTVLYGGYIEYLPSASWNPRSGVGPRWPGMELIGREGNSVFHNATDLHSVGRLLKDHAWTLVQTGPRVRDWGFHPEGKPWVPWRQYIAERRKQEDAAKGVAQSVAAAAQSPDQPLSDTSLDLSDTLLPIHTGLCPGNQT